MIGIDIEDIERFNLPKDNRFIRKVFNKNEISYCFSQSKPSQHLAAKFAGKEAVMKAVNNIKKNYFDYKEIEIINDKNGVPRVIINKVLKRILNKYKIYISLSHSKDKAIANVVIF